MVGFDTDEHTGSRVNCNKDYLHVIKVCCWSDPRGFGGDVSEVMNLILDVSDL